MRDGDGDALERACSIGSVGRGEMMRWGRKGVPEVEEVFMVSGERGEEERKA